MWSYLDWWVQNVLRPKHDPSQIHRSYTAVVAVRRSLFYKNARKMTENPLTLKKISKVHFWTICQNIYFVQSIVIRVKLKNQSYLKMMNRFIFLILKFSNFETAPKLCNLGSTNRPCTTRSDLDRHLSIHTVPSVPYGPYLLYPFVHVKSSQSPRPWNPVANCCDNAHSILTVLKNSTLIRFWYEYVKRKWVLVVL